MDNIQTVQRGIDYIESRLFERIELEQVAQAAAMSVPNLYRLFYAMTGHPIKEYIRKRRVSEAAELLRFSTESVVDIAFHCGFDSYPTFAKAFKKLVGLTPSDYRKSEVFYSFERMELSEQVSYQEDRGLFDRYPDVKVIRLNAGEALAYDYYAEERDGLELTALRLFQDRLVTARVDLSTIRIFGYDLESSTDAVFGYRLIALLTQEAYADQTEAELVRVLFPEGLYAVKRIPYGPPSSIITAWNRVLADWLPRSTFMLGDRPFLEEYLRTTRGTVQDLKLYLPVVRKQAQENIEIVDLPAMKVFCLRAEGPDADTKADEQLVRWLLEQGLSGHHDLQLYMSHSYGFARSEEELTSHLTQLPAFDPRMWVELGVILPTDKTIPRSERNVNGKIMHHGGLYACMKTRAYGLMTGVLDQIYRFVGQSDRFVLDDKRQWFAIYDPGTGEEIERTASAVCYIPIIERR